MKESLTSTFFPELGEQKKGIVKGIYSYNDQLIMIASDRIAAFDKIVSIHIPDKGRIFTQLSLYWFEKTKDLIGNHLIFSPDPNVLVVKKCRQIPIEVVVRKYITGSIWKDFKAGKKEKCGLKLPDNLKENQELENPIITPVTKNAYGHRKDISEAEILKQEIISEDLWNKMQKTALALFRRGEEILARKGLILVDAKYEFALDAQNKLILVEEIHTPDSSRLWYQRQIKLDPYHFPDNEFTKQCLMKQGFMGYGKPPKLPLRVQERIKEGYIKVYEFSTGSKIKANTLPTKDRILQRLKSAKILQGHFMLILGSEKDQQDTEKISSVLRESGIAHRTIFTSIDAQIQQIIEEYNQSLEPMLYIIVTRENALLEKAIKTCNWPVVVLQKDKQYVGNKTKMIVNDPVNAALSALRILRNMEQMSL